MPEGDCFSAKTWADPARHTVAYVGSCEAGLRLGLGTGLYLGLGLGLRSEAGVGTQLLPTAPGTGYDGRQGTFASAAAQN